MVSIIPAIIPESQTHLVSTLARVTPFSLEQQIDIVDGKFVPFISWPYNEQAAPMDLAPLIQGCAVELDLMIMNPETVVEEYLKIGIKRIVIHLESTERFADIVALKNTYKFLLGISINNDTPFEVLLSEIEHVDFVQLMGIRDIGSQGQPFDTRVLGRIKEIKAKCPSLSLSVDGSVNKETLPLLTASGVDRCIAGSSILLSDDPRAAYQELVQLTT